MMVGITIASMIAIESIRIVLSAAVIGPCGSRMFIGYRLPTSPVGTNLARSSADHNASTYDSFCREGVRLRIHTVLSAFETLHTCAVRRRQCVRPFRLVAGLRQHVAELHHLPRNQVRYVNPDMVGR